MTVEPSPVAVTAMETAQIDHARQNAAGAMCLTNATLRPDRSGNVTAQHGNPANWAHRFTNWA